jgi:hypothetical protein
VEIQHYEFGRIVIDGEEFERDLVIDGGRVRKRRKKPSKALKSKYGHTPLSTEERIPWDCSTLWVGTGMYGSLPITREVHTEAERRGVKLLIEKTPDLVNRLRKGPPENTNVILHLTC